MSEKPPEPCDHFFVLDKCIHCGLNPEDAENLRIYEERKSDESNKDLIAEFIADIQEWLDCGWGNEHDLMRITWIKDKQKWEERLK